MSPQEQQEVGLEVRLETRLKHMLRGWAGVAKARSGCPGLR